MNNQLVRQPQPIYEIRIRGRIEDRWADWFENLAFNHEEDGTTTLRGPLEDQAALHGVLNHIKNLNLPLIYVRTIDEEEEENMNKYQGTINLILKAVALGMGAAVVVLGILGVVTTETSITLLGIGLFALALTALQGSN